MYCRVLEDCEGVRCIPGLGGSSSELHCCISIRRPAVAALQETWITDINWKFRTAGNFGRGDCSGELNCCILGGRHWREKKEKKIAIKIPGSKIYQTGRINRGQYNMDKTKDRHNHHSACQHSRYYGLGVF